MIFAISLMSYANSQIPEEFEKSSVGKIMKKGVRERVREKRKYLEIMMNFGRSVWTNDASLEN